MTVDEITEIAKLAHEPLGDQYLDGLFNTAPSAIYYRFEHHLVKRMRPDLIVELGVETGRCSAHLAVGAPAAKIISVDCAPKDDWLAPVLARYPNIDFRRDSSTARGLVYSVADHSVDLCCVDTDHCSHQVMSEYGVWFQKMKPGGVMLFDDIDLNEEMQLAWSVLKTISPHLRHVSLSELHHSGFGAILF